MCEVAKKRGALVIAAHIDEFNSISSMNSANLEKLLSGGYIDAVQVANLPVWRKLQEDKDAAAMQKTLEEQYGPDATPQEVERWRKCFNRAEEMGLPMLAFSDNPASPGESHHGLWGIGSVYTWIQMDDVINLESIRQSLLTTDSRIRMMYDSENEPKGEPDFWIRYIDIRKTELNPHQNIHLAFHPQMNCIIGGKGSGKSAIVRILLGIYQQLTCRMLKNTWEAQTRFYQQHSKDGYGILHEDSEIEIRYVWYGCEYRMLVTEFRSMEDQKFSFFRLDPQTKEEVPVDQEALLTSVFLRAQVFVQRQIHEMTQTPGALLSFVDRCIFDMYILQARKEYILERLVNLSVRLQEGEKFCEDGSRVRSELSWLQSLDKNRIPEYFHGVFPGMIQIRQDAVERMEQCRQKNVDIHNRQQKLLEEYENTLAEIHELRTAFINQVLADDENYRMELKPMASRDSLRKILRELLPGNETLLAGDIRKLEEVLFEKKNGIANYTRLLREARQCADANEAEKIGFSAYFVHLIRQMKEIDFCRLLLFRPEDELCMFYHPNGVKRFFPMATASNGEKATAVFSFILFSSFSPLIIDQPEEDMDNRVIYQEVLHKLKKAKNYRQLIIVTHNANIALNADAGMILSLDSWSKFVRLRMQGSVDNDEIRREICNVIEGSEEAFVRRVKKYHF